MNPAPGVRHSIDRITSDQLSRFLDSQDGWILHSRRTFDETWVFATNPNSRRVVIHIPTDPADVDYSRREAEAIEEVASALQISVDDLTALVRCLGADRITIEGFLPDAREFSDASRRLRTLSILTHFMTDVAERSRLVRTFEKQVLVPLSLIIPANLTVVDVGRTVSIAVPAGPLRVPLIAPQGLNAQDGSTQGQIPLTGRDVTSAMIRTLHSVQSDLNASISVEPIDSDADRKLRVAAVESILGMTRDGVDDFHIDFHWYGMGPDGQIGPSEIHFSAAELSRLESTREQYLEM